MSETEGNHPDPPQGWTDLETIQFIFEPHQDREYANIHKSLNTDYSDYIDGEQIDALFTDNTRTELRDDAIDALKQQLITIIEENATQTPPTTTGRIAPIIRDLPMFCRYREMDHGDTIKKNARLTRKAKLEKELRRMRTNHKDSIIVYVNINALDFRKVNCKLTNFDHIGNARDPPEPDPVPATPTNGTDRGFEQDQDRTPQQGQPRYSSPRQSSPYSPFEDLGYFNLSTLPPDVKRRVEAKRSDARLLTKNEIDVCFHVGTQENPQKTCVSYFAPPNKLITRDGTLHNLYAGRTPDKRFATNVPEISGNKITPTRIRMWYHRFANYCGNYGIFVCPYYCFRPNRQIDNKYGFTCGDDTELFQFDLPARFQWDIPRWSNWIAMALKDVFPKDSIEYALCQQNDDDGYSALYSIIYHNHPEFHEYGETLAMNQPFQSKDQSIIEHYNEYMDYLQMRAYTENNPKNLNSQDQMIKFILTCRWGDQILERTRMDRKDNSEVSQQRYTQGGILQALREELKHVDTSKPAFKDKRRDSVFTPRREPDRERYKRTDLGKRIERKRPPSHRKEIKREIKRLQAIENIEDAIPEGSSKEEKVIESIYRLGATILKNGGNFDVTQPCLVCKKPGHTFENCKILKNHDLLKEFHIQYCSLFKKLNKKTEEAIANAVHRISIDTSSPQQETSSESSEEEEWYLYDEEDF